MMIIKGYSNHCDKDFFKFLVESQSGHRDQTRKSFYQIWKLYFTLIFAISLYLANFFIRKAPWDLDTIKKLQNF